MKVVLPFEFGQRVTIDDEKSIVATVFGFEFYGHSRILIAVAWFSNGVQYNATVDHWRLKPADD